MKNNKNVLRLPKVLQKIKKINLYLILALIVLMIGLFIYNYSKFNEGFNDNAVRDYINASRWSDLANIDPASEERYRIRYNIYKTLFTRWPRATKFFTDALDKTYNYSIKVTKANYLLALKAQEDLDYWFFNFMASK